MHWGFWLILLVLIPGVVLGIAFVLLNEDPFARPVFFSVLIVWAIITVFTLDREILPMWRTFMVIDQRGLSGRSDRFEYEIYWVEIVAANVFGETRPWLWLATGEHSIQISLKHLDAKRIWQQIVKRLDSENVGYDAYDRWLNAQGVYEQWGQENIALINDTLVPLRTRRTESLLIFGGVGLVSFVSCSIFSFAVGVGGLGIMACILSGVPAAALVACVFSNTIEMDQEKVSRIIPLLGRYQIRWDEIKRIEYGPRSECLVFYGNGKRLPILGPGRWSKRSGPQVERFLQAQIEQRGIEIRANPVAPLIVLSKNARE